MILHVVNVEYLHDHVLRLRFNDGAAGEVDLSGELEGEVFVSLKDVALFKTARLHPLMQTVVWDNGADMAPEFLYAHLQISVE